jgi:hypothetical protein
MEPKFLLVPILVILKRDGVTVQKQFHAQSSLLASMSTDPGAAPNDPSAARKYLAVDSLDHLAWYVCQVLGNTPSSPDDPDADPKLSLVIVGSLDPDDESPYSFDPEDSAKGFPFDFIYTKDLRCIYTPGPDLQRRYSDLYAAQVAASLVSDSAKSSVVPPVLGASSADAKHMFHVDGKLWHFYKIQDPTKHAEALAKSIAILRVIGTSPQ